jgi:hypothetical protein
MRDKAVLYLKLMRSPEFKVELVLRRNQGGKKTIGCVLSGRKEGTEGGQGVT